MFPSFIKCAKIHEMKTRQDIVSMLSAVLPEVKTRFKVKTLGLFGSFARGDQRPDSDVDIYVEIDPSIGLDFVTLANKLEDLLGQRVDLVSSRAIPPAYLTLIKDELIYV
jgi:uncharacterized protein